MTCSMMKNIRLLCDFDKLSVYCYTQGTFAKYLLKSCKYGVVSVRFFGNGNATTAIPE